MALVSLQNLSIGFRGPLLLDDVSCQIEPAQRIGLLGRNGSGKTTLMRMLCGQVQPDAGEILFTAGARVSLLPQDVPSDITGTIAEVVSLGQTFAEVTHRNKQQAADEHAEEDAWKHEHRVETILSRMKLSGESLFETLSSGMKRRVLLAQALVREPDLLLLDEPTNHLDISAIEWLENFLLQWKTTLIFVTHDRMFLRRMATRILEIDRGNIFDWSCDYDTFLERKEAALAAEEKQNKLFDKKLAIEEVWIRQGIKARRTRNEGRVRSLEKMREARHARRSKQGTSNLVIEQGNKSGALVAAMKSVSFSYPDLPILESFSTTIMRGDKVGIIGPNGVGKTTFLSILLGKLSPDSGTVKLGTNQNIAYFDQLREQLDEDTTVQDNIADGQDHITIAGITQHVLGYLQNFLFTPERARTQVRFLSGGERNRVLLARLFSKPANVIVLDEPTNDLDSETLELLEQRLVGFDGTILLVSHDRAFLNNVVTSSIVFEPEGVKEYVGGYDDWLRQRAESMAIAKQSKAETQAATFQQTQKQQKPSNGQIVASPSEAPNTAVSKPRKLSFKEQQELKKTSKTN